MDKALKFSSKPPARRIREPENVTARAVRLAGGPKAVARKLKIRSLWSVYKWIKNDRIPTAKKRVLRMEELSGVSRYELRNDVYGTAPKRLEARP